MLVSGQAVGQQGQPADDEKTEQWNTLARICGKLGFHHEKKNGEYDFKGIRGARIRLYRREAGVDCCDASALVEETLSGRGGSFRLKAKDGRYWLAVEVNGTEHQMRLTQNKKADGEDFRCSDNSFEMFDDGRFELGKTITVD
jgi:hypothetical protein